MANGVRNVVERQPRNKGFFVTVLGAIWELCCYVFGTLWQFGCWLYANFSFKRVLKETLASFTTLFIPCVVSTIAFALPESSRWHTILTWAVGPLTSGFFAWVSFYLWGRRFSDTHGYTMVTLAFMIHSPSHTFVRAQIPSYILGQILGTEASTWLVRFCMLPFHHIKLICPTLCVDSKGLCICAEFSLTIVRVFTQYRFAGYEWNGTRGWITGSVITILIASSGHVTGGSMNILRSMAAFIASDFYPNFWYVFVVGSLPACILCALILRFCGPKPIKPPQAPPNSPSGSPQSHYPLPSARVERRVSSPSSERNMLGSDSDGDGSPFRAAPSSSRASPDLTQVMQSPSHRLSPISPSSIQRSSSTRETYRNDVMGSPARSSASPSALPRAPSSGYASDHRHDTIGSPMSGIPRSGAYTPSLPSGASPSRSTESVSRLAPHLTPSSADPSENAT